MTEQPLRVLWYRSPSIALPGLGLLTIIPLLLPWSPHLPSTLKNALQSEHLETRFLLAWLIAPALFFTFRAGQSPQDLLLCYPAFFLLLTIFWNQETSLQLFGKVVRISALIFPAILGLGLVIIGLTQVQRGREALDLALLSTLSGGMTLSLAIIGASLLYRQKFARIASVSAFLSLTLFFILATLVARHSHLSLRLREASGTAPPSLASFGYDEVSLAWYYDNFDDRGNREFWASPHLQELGSREASQTLILQRRWTLDRKSWSSVIGLKPIPLADDYTHQLISRYGQERIHNAQVVSGWSPRTASWCEILILE